MDLDAWQQEFEVWIRANFPDQTLELQALAVAKEAGDLCRAVLQRAQAPRAGHVQHDEAILRELGDIVMAATWIAFLSGNSMGNVLLKRWAEVSAPRYLDTPSTYGEPKHERTEP